MKKAFGFIIGVIVLASFVLADNPSLLDSSDTFDSAPLKYVEAVPVAEESFRDSQAYIVILSVLIAVFFLIFFALLLQLFR